MKFRELLLQADAEDDRCNCETHGKPYPEPTRLHVAGESESRSQWYTNNPEADEEYWIPVKPKDHGA